MIFFQILLNWESIFAVEIIRKIQSIYQDSKVVGSKFKVRDFCIPAFVRTSKQHSLRDAED